MEKNIIQLYEEVKDNRGRFPKNIWIGIDGKENFIILFKHLSKNRNSKDQLKKLTLKYFKENHIYVPLKKYFNGNIFEVINYCYPNKLRAFEMENLPKSYWNNRDNIKEVFEFYTKDLKKSEILNLKKDWFYEHKLSTPLSKIYRNSPYLFIKDVYMGGEKFERKIMFKGFWNKQIANDVYLKKRRNIDEIPTAKELRMYGLGTPLKKFFNNSPKKFLEYSENMNKAI